MTNTGFVFSKRSEQNLHGVHPDLVRVVKKALFDLTTEDFAVIEGLRSKHRQRRLMAEGKSKTLNSRHITGHAVDLAWVDDGGISWNTKNVRSVYDLNQPVGSYEGYQAIGMAMLKAGKELNVPIRWGADWDSDGQHTDHSFLDWVHFEIPKGHGYDKPYHG